MNSKNTANEESGPPPRGYRLTACPGCGCGTLTRTGDAEPRPCFGCRIGIDVEGATA
jgi:hypothetical protein